MKRKLAIVIGVMVAAGVLGIGIFHSGASQVEPSLTKADIQDLVGEQYPGEITQTALETEENRPVYEVEISADDRDYNLKLDGDTGETLNIETVNNATAHKDSDHKEEEGKEKEQEKDKEKKQAKEKDKAEKKEKKEQNQQEEEQKETSISYEEATSIALQQFSGEIEEVELEKEDGKLIYEVEIERDEQEAEVEIDAYTGEVIVIEIEED